MRRRIYFSLFLILGMIGIGSIYMVQSAKETLIPGIPAEAIRLRILANSDQLEDQLIKRKVRDQVVAEMGSWVKKPQTIESARVAVKEHLPRFQQIASDTVARNGYDYAVKVDFGQVPFPTKLYGNQVYAAGEYEALRITLGEGKGGNWWCVLFPPLCFIDMGNGDAVQKPRGLAILPLEGQAYAEADPRDQPAIRREALVVPKKVVQVSFLLLDKIEDLLR